MKAYWGRWSELELSGEGFEEFPPSRLVAAADGAEALHLLGCPRPWFEAHFAECDTADIAAVALAAPGVVFESRIETDWDNAGGPFIYHYISLDALAEFDAAVSRKRQEAMAASKVPLPSRPMYNPFRGVDPEELAQCVAAAIPKA
jgi:hypothetical protein